VSSNRDLHEPLILVGYWLGPYAPGWPDPHDFVDPSWDAFERQQMVYYLKRGMTARAFMGLSECRFCRQRVGALEFSDGVYIWPEGLAHYVSEHDVRLPAVFVDHAAGMTESLEARSVDRSWWATQSGLEPTDRPVP